MSKFFSLLLFFNFPEAHIMEIKVRVSPMVGKPSIMSNTPSPNGYFKRALLLSLRGHCEYKEVLSVPPLPISL